MVAAGGAIYPIDPKLLVGLLLGQKVHRAAEANV
jgi:hypothetical protein